MSVDELQNKLEERLLLEDIENNKTSISKCNIKKVLCNIYLKYSKFTVLLLFSELILSNFLN